MGLPKPKGVDLLHQRYSVCLLCINSVWRCLCKSILRSIQNGNKRNTSFKVKKVISSVESIPALFTFAMRTRFFPMHVKAIMDAAKD